MRIVLATNNPGKIEELKKLLPPKVEILSLSDVGLNSPIEDGRTFLENARIKAAHAAGSGYVSIADDSGLSVDALEGSPGVVSSRFAGDSASDYENNEYLLKSLSRTTVRNRSARFTSVVVLEDGHGASCDAEASLQGRIINQPRGNHGFGYDPLFEIWDIDAQQFNGKTLAELSIDEKNSISHRARAYRILLQKLHESSRLSTNLSALLTDRSGVCSP